MVAKARVNGAMHEYAIAMTSKLVNFGNKLPYEMPFICEYDVNFSRGVLSQKY